MQSINWVRYSFLSLFFSLATSFITLVHHIHSGLVLHPDSGSFHVVLIEIVLLPLTIASMIIYLRNGSRVAFGSYLFIAFLGFVFLGLFEGGWNHTAKLIGYLRIDNPAINISEILPPYNYHVWFYEISGVATFVCAMLASWFSYRFYKSATTHKD